jgi:curved DNA-binding protein CbpA
MAETIEDVHQKIDQMHARIDQDSYYELLELDPEQPLDSKTVMKQFRLKAKDWHADRYSGIDLDAAHKQKLQEIFSALNTAHQTLSDDDKRADYEFELQAGDQNIENIINAEGSFRRGKNMLQTGSYTGAHEQFKQACELHPEETEYKAHLLYTEYLKLPKSEDGKTLERARAKEIFDRIDEVSREKPEDDSILTFLGVVAMGLGNLRKAQSLFNEARQHNRGNVVAQRQLRLIKMRRKRESEKGFFDKLLDKFRT